MNGSDANIAAYQKSGGTVLSNASQVASYAPAYADLTSQHALQVVPVTAADHRSAEVTLGEVSPSFGYTGSVTLHPNGLNLAGGKYHVVDVLTGKAPAQKLLADGSVCVPVTMTSAQLDQWSVLPGAAPAGTPVPATCPATGSGATSVTGTAGQSRRRPAVPVGRRDRSRAATATSRRSRRAARPLMRPGPPRRAGSRRPTSTCSWTRPARSPRRPR